MNQIHGPSVTCSGEFHEARRVPFKCSLSVLSGSPIYTVAYIQSEVCCTTPNNTGSLSNHNSQDSTNRSRVNRGATMAMPKIEYTV